MKISAILVTFLVTYVTASKNGVEPRTGPIIVAEDVSPSRDERGRQSKRSLQEGEYGGAYDGSSYGSNPSYGGHGASPLGGSGAGLYTEAISHNELPYAPAHALGYGGDHGGSYGGGHLGGAFGVAEGSALETLGSVAGAAYPVGQEVVAEHTEEHHTVPVRTVGVPVPHPVPVRIPQPIAVPHPIPYKIPDIKVVPYPVIKKIPYPVEKPYPVNIIQKVPIPIPKPYPVHIPVYKIKKIYHHDAH